MILGQFALSIPITPKLIFSLLALIVAVWLVFSLIIRYHWKNYGTGGVEIFSMNFVYSVGSLIGIGIMVFLAICYATSAL